MLAARPAVEALDTLAIDAEPVLRASRLSRKALASLDARLSHEDVARLWQEAALAAGDPAFGIHVAERLPSGAYDVIDYVLATAKTVGEGLARLTRYVRLIYDNSNLRLLIEPHAARLVRRVPAPAPQYDEFTWSLLLVRSRQACGVEWAPERMAVQHEEHTLNGEINRVFSCPVLFGAHEAEMELAPSVLELPHTRSDARLLSLLARYADHLLVSQPDRRDIHAAVSSAITQQMGRELPTLPSVAAVLQLPERTLQRRLAEKGVSFSGLLDEVRHALAVAYIGDARLSAAEIGYMLHFADPAAFHRAFKRWTGEAPLSYRRRIFGPP